MLGRKADIEVKYHTKLLGYKYTKRQFVKIICQNNIIYKCIPVSGRKEVIWDFIIYLLAVLAPLTIISVKWQQKEENNYRYEFLASVLSLSMFLPFYS